MRISVLLIVMLMAAFIHGSAAARDEADPYGEYRGEDEPGREYDYDDSQIKPWKESAREIPVLSEKGLVDVQIDHGPPGLTYQIDLDTLSIDPEDQIVRYWLVMKSGGRRTNTVYEGINCTELFYKTYAYASNRRSSLVKPMNKAKWQEMKRRSDKDYRFEMQEDYFCTQARPKSKNAMVQAILGNVDLTNMVYEDSESIRR